MKFVIFRDKAKEWRWRLVGSNGKIVAQSEGYSRRAGVMKSINSIKRSVANARVEIEK